MTTKPKPKVSRRRPGWALVLAIAGILVGRFLCAPLPDSTPMPAETATDAVAEAIWTCSMHPQIQRSEPGSCPLCGMDLVPMERSGTGAAPGSLVMSEAAVALADIRTAPVERRAVTRDVRMVGRVAFDETRMASITARVPGRLERLFVDYTGVTVRAGDHMVEIYSPQLVTTQQELLAAMATLERMSDDRSVPMVRAATEASVEAARERLRLWGLLPQQTDAIVAQGTPQERVTLNAPIGGIVVDKNAVEGAYVETGTQIYSIADLTRVWVRLDAYESDLGWLRYGQDVTFTTEAWPGTEFVGRVAFIDPVLDDATRTVKVRVNVDNADGRLKPDMFVRATVRAPLTPFGHVVDPEIADRWMCPMHPEVVEDDAGSCRICGMDLMPARELGFVAAPESELPLVIPATAPLVTGTRAVVYVRVPDAAEPTFEARVITLGPRAGDDYVVAAGLAEGERVVVHGAFKLDAEQQIRAQPSMMNPQGGTSAPVHHHGQQEHGQQEHEAEDG